MLFNAVMVKRAVVGRKRETEEKSPDGEKRRERERERGGREGGREE
jgi:hypothetical protein